MSGNSGVRAGVVAAAILAGILSLARTASTVAASGDEPQPSGQKSQDPAAWGSNHAGKPVPEFVHGDECLFCHRENIGSDWKKNAHAVTVRDKEDAPDAAAVLKAQPKLALFELQVTYFLGSRHHLRFMKKEGYGKFSLLNTQAVLGPNHQAERWIDLEKPAWNAELFSNQCAGCHATGVEAKTRTFSAFGIDCYTCHGDVSLEHTGNTQLIWLSKKNHGDAKAVESTCAQCHLRLAAKSRSTGLPYPNNFVPGDNLFQDYQVDLAKADDPSLNAGDRHIYRNVRDVVLNGDETTTCISCHQVHANSSMKHRRAPRTAICSDCHNGEGYKDLKPYSVKSELCQY